MSTCLGDAPKSSGRIAAKTVLSLTRLETSLLVFGFAVAGCDASESPPKSTANAGASGTGDLSSGASGSPSETDNTGSQDGNSMGGSAHAGEPRLGCWPEFSIYVG